MPTFRGHIRLGMDFNFEARHKSVAEPELRDILNRYMLHEIIQRQPHVTFWGHDAEVLKVDQVEEVKDLIPAGEPAPIDLNALVLSDPHWARFIAWGRSIGVGFHPDTEGKDYSPPLKRAEIKSYDEAIANVFAYCNDHDPYAVGAAILDEVAERY